MAPQLIANMEALDEGFDFIKKADAAEAGGDMAAAREVRRSSVLSIVAVCSPVAFMPLSTTTPAMPCPVPYSSPAPPVAYGHTHCRNRNYHGVHHIHRCSLISTML